MRSPDLPGPPGEARLPDPIAVTVPSRGARGRARLDPSTSTAAAGADRCLHALFHEQVRRAPDAVATACGDASLTYAGLDEAANRLAHLLRELGVGPEVLVAVAMERSLDLIVSLLAVLKAGGAYVPLDPAYPAARLS